MRNFIVVACIFAGSTVFSGTTYHVSTSGSHTPPFHPQFKAATNIQAAVNLASDGDTVLIHDGTYFPSVEITVATRIQIISENGPFQTTVDGGGSIRCFYLSDVACIVSGLTITNGYSDSDSGAEGGGVYCDGDSPMVINCIITGCSSADYGGGMVDGILYDSIVEYNTADFAGGGLSDSTVCNSMIINNTATDYSGGMEGGVASNCLFEGNTCGEDGGASSFGTIYNCTVVGNASGNDGGGFDRGHSYNSIIYSNTVGGAVDDISNPVDLEFCCSPDATNGVGNITGVPLFINFPGGNYRLQRESPCNDAGTNGYVSSTMDLDGKNRIYGGTVDIGAYEISSSATDEDGDEMLDSWEILYFGSTNAQPSTDTDSDQLANLGEYIAGTDPTNGASFFVVTNELTSSGFIFEWRSIPNREYRVFWEESMTNNFQQISSTIDYPQNSYTDTVYSVESSGFYNVEIQIKW